MTLFYPQYNSFRSSFAACFSRCGNRCISCVRAGCHGASWSPHFNQRKSNRTQKRQAKHDGFSFTHFDPIWIFPLFEAPKSVSYVARPQTRKLAQALPCSTTLIFGNVQRVPSWYPYLKRLMHPALAGDRCCDTVQTSISLEANDSQTHRMDTTNVWKGQLTPTRSLLPICFSIIMSSQLYLHSLSDLVSAGSGQVLSPSPRP